MVRNNDCQRHVHPSRSEMLHRGIPEDELQRCDVDLDAWLGGHAIEASVRRTVDAIRQHPLMPADVTVRGFIIDSATGASKRWWLNPKFAPRSGSPPKGSTRSYPALRTQLAPAARLASLPGAPDPLLLALRITG